jgi:hypothetical protein
MTSFVIRRGGRMSNGRYWIQKELSMASYPQLAETDQLLHFPAIHYHQYLPSEATTSTLAQLHEWIPRREGTNKEKQVEEQLVRFDPLDILIGRLLDTRFFLLLFFLFAPFP